MENGESSDEEKENPEMEESAIGKHTITLLYEKISFRHFLQEQVYYNRKIC